MTITVIVLVTSCFLSSFSPEVAYDFQVLCDSEYSTSACMDWMNQFVANFYEKNNVLLSVHSNVILARLPMFKKHQREE